MPILMVFGTSAGVETETLYRYFRWFRYAMQSVRGSGTVFGSCFSRWRPGAVSASRNVQLDGRRSGGTR